MDDYKYQSKPANQKNEWPNALGSAGSLRLSGLAGKSSAYSSMNAIGGTGANTGAPNIGNTGSVTNISGGSSLPEGVLGNMLYNDGSEWVVFNKPATDGVLSIVAGVPTWITTSNNGSLIYYDGNLGSWLTIPAPTGAETYVLGFKNNILEWLQTTDCGATGP
jgi:hypothetical protein